jgi:hypothetical protein
MEIKFGFHKSREFFGQLNDYQFPKGFCLMELVALMSVVF